MAKSISLTFIENCFTCYSKFEMSFTSTSKYIVAARVLTNSDNTYSGCTFEDLGTESVSITIPASSEKGFSAVVLTIAERRWLNTGATISGIDDTYLDDGVNQPVPTVTYKESSSSPSVTLTEGVDYTVRYTYNTDRTKGTVYVEGMGEHYGTVFKSFSIRQLSLSEDFNSLGSDKYEIATRDDLDRLAKFVNNGNNCSGVTFLQTADINYNYTDAWSNYPTSTTENNFTPIGGYGKPFQGTYNGQGHTISGIRVDKTSASSNHEGESLGLFGYVFDGTVRNVFLRNSRFKGEQNIGGIVGYLHEGNVTDCLLYQVLTACGVGNAGSNGVGIIRGNGSGSYGSNYYRDCRVAYETEKAHIISNNQINNLYAITLGTGVTASATGYTIDGTTYYAAGTDVTLNYSGGSETFTMPARDVIPLLNGYDNSAVIAANVGDGKNVILTGRTLYKDGNWNTLCLPFNTVLIGDLANATVMELDAEAGSYTHITGFEGGTLYLTFKTAPSIVAGIPYIIKWEGTNMGDPIENPTFSGVTIPAAYTSADAIATTLANAAVSSEDGKLTFTGTYDYTQYATENRSILFLGAGNTLYYPQSGATVGAFRAYFQLNGITAGNITAARLFFGEETQGIVSMEDGRGKMSDGWYTIDGRKLDGKPVKKGLYIRNGKAVLVK